MGEVKRSLGAHLGGHLAGYRSAFVQAQRMIKLGREAGGPIRPNEINQLINERRPGISVRPRNTSKNAIQNSLIIGLVARSVYDHLPAHGDRE